jgi:hypothetical protein
MLMASGAVCACRASFPSSSLQVSCELSPLAYARERSVTSIANRQHATFAPSRSRRVIPMPSHVSKLLVAILFITPLTPLVVPAHGQTPEKPRIAIRTPRLAQGLDPKTAPPQYISILLAEMEASLRATRKFEVLTRQMETLEDIREEQRFAKTPLAKRNAAREGALENANYLVVPVIQDFQFFSDIRSNQVHLQAPQ